MAIQIPNPGTGNALTGDNEYVLWSKVKGNFENQTHAASRLVGASNGNVPVYSSNGLSDMGYGSKAVLAITDAQINTVANAMPAGWYATNQNSSSDQRFNYASILQFAYHDARYARQLLIASDAGIPVAYVRASSFSGSTEYLSARIYTSLDPIIYNTTTASGANTVITASGELRRSTSSERYKDILADLELDDDAYKNAMQLAPIVYRSTAEADNPDYHYYSFSAEKLGAYDPAFTLWRETETVTDDEGNVTEQPLDERQAEGLNLNAIVAFLHATNIKQDKIIKVQAEAIETLTKRIDAMTAP